MDLLVVAVVFATILGVWTWFLHVRSNGRIWSPLWMAFTCTAFSAMLLLAGTSGYTLSRHERFLTGTRWAGTVIWWEVWSGLAVSVLAIYFWRKAIRQERRRLHSSRS